MSLQLGLLWPWALLCAVSLPLLVLLYWLRQRVQRRRVPSLLLWAQQRPEMSAGRRWRRWQRSRLFWLELLILALLALAAAGPGWQEADRQPLVIVLDDSLSMRAGQEASPRALGEEALRQLLQDDGPRPRIWLLAGRRVRRLTMPKGGPRGPSTGALEERWKCLAPQADLATAIAQAVELGGAGAHVLVLTDRTPPDNLDTSRLRWWAFGEPRPNVALVGAGRRRDGAVDHLLLEVANLSPQPVSPQLKVAWRPADLAAGDLPGEPSQPTVSSLQLDLAPGEHQRHRLRLPRGSLVEASLPADALQEDNHVVLLPEERPTVTVALDLPPGPRRQLLERALAAGGLARLLPADHPEADLHIAMGPRPPTAPGNGTEARETAAGWHLWLSPSTEAAQPYVGPFILDHSHPLSEGLALEGTVWGADPALRMADLSPSDRPVISAGEVPLLIDHGDGQLSLRWQPELSNLQRTVNWPVLWWNLLAACSRQRPGLEPINGRLGLPFTWRLAAGEAGQSATLQSPEGTRREVPAGTLESDDLGLGLHLLRWGGRQGGEHRQSFVVNALTAAESDLRQGASLRLGAWPRAAGSATTWRSLVPYLLLLALLLCALHLAWTRPAGGAS